MSPHVCYSCQATGLSACDAAGPVFSPLSIDLAAGFHDVAVDLTNRTSFHTSSIAAPHGRRVQRSNLPDALGFHDASELLLGPVHEHPFLRRTPTRNTELVDEHATVTTFPSNLSL